MNYVNTVGTMCQFLHNAKVLPSRRTFQEVICILGCAGIPLEDAFEFTPFGVYSTTAEDKLDRLIDEKYVVLRGEKIIVLTGITRILELTDMPPTPHWSETTKWLLQLEPDVLEAMSMMALLRRIDVMADRIKIDFKFLRPDWAHQTEWFLKEIETLRDKYRLENV